MNEETFTGFTARLFLHEYDHMEGIVYTDIVSPIILDRAKRKVKANIKKLKAQKIASLRAEKHQSTKRTA